MVSFTSGWGSWLKTASRAVTDHPPASLPRGSRRPARRQPGDASPQSTRSGGLITSPPSLYLKVTPESGYSSDLRKRGLAPESGYT